MIKIEHIPAGVVSANVVRNFLTESAVAYPQEVGSPDILEWPSKLANRADIFCVRRPDGSLSSALFAYLNDVVTKVGFIPFFCSLPECAKGTAYLIYKMSTCVASSRGMNKWRLEVLKGNTHALSFYLRQGFLVVADHAAQDRWLMESGINVGV